MDQSLAFRENKSVPAKHLLVRIGEIQTGNRIRHYPAERFRSGRKYVPEFQARDHRVVDIEKQAQTIAFVREELLSRLNALVVEGVLYGNRDLFGDLL